MSRWNEPFGKMESDMTPHEQAVARAQRRLQKLLDDGEITKEELTVIYQGNWVDYANDG